MNGITWIDLPVLQSIELGKYALCGKNEKESSSLEKYVFDNRAVGRERLNNKG